MKNGIIVKHDSGGTRLEIRSQNQAGVLYAVPAAASWVAEPDQLHAHALAGFLTDLVSLRSSEVRSLMDKWGLYFRPLELDPENEGRVAG